jgi:hypothetical protein
MVLAVFICSCCKGGLNILIFLLAAFLPPECIELTKINVDINPEYADSLDDMTFSVHLLFEPADETALQKVENKEFANSYQLRGKEAFESGLDEVCTHLT